MQIVRIDDLVKIGKKFKDFVSEYSPEVKKFIAEHREEFTKIISVYKEELMEYLDSFRSKELSYDTVMKYFLQHKDDNKAIVKGAILKEEVENGYIITQVFLDNDNKMLAGDNGKPIGCKYVVEKLDGELMKLFENNDLVIVK
jgi:hypothetical protein